MSNARKNTARKIVGSLGVLGAAAAVAGLGTFGSFTDSTTPVTATVGSGTLDINLTDAAAFPLTAAGLVPGDSVSRPVTLKNDGTAGLASVNLDVTATTSSVLDTDTDANGLRLKLQSCPTAWSQDSTGTPTYSCSGAVRDLGTGPVRASRTLDNPASLNPGGTDHLLLTLSLPGSADNTFQGKTSVLSLQFKAFQRDGGPR